MNKNFIVALTLLLNGCSFEPELGKPDLSLPNNWTFSQPIYPEKNSSLSKSNCPKKKASLKKEENRSLDNFFQIFNDKELNELVKEALNTNNDILLAMNNVTLAQAQFNLEKSYLFPTINLQGSSERTKNSKAITSNQNNSRFSNEFNIAGALSYQIDLWGKVSSATKAARASLLASKYTQESVLLSVLSNVATSYFNLLSLDRQIEVTKELIDIQEQIYKLTKSQYSAGAIDEVTLSQAESDLVTSNSQLTPLEQQLIEQEHAFKILLGKSPADLIASKIARNKKIDDLPIVPIVPSILPSELLEQRPDIQAAEQSLIAANAGIGLAKAAYFPSISLTGLLGIGSSNLDKIFSGAAHTWETSAGVSLPILDFGNIKSNIKIAEASKEQYLLQYKNTVRTAFQEVLDYLSLEESTKKLSNSAKKNESLMKKSYNLIGYRYKVGNASYIDLLNSKKDFIQSKLTTLITKQNQLVAMVNLFQALGGSWNSEIDSVNHTAKAHD